MTKGIGVQGRTGYVSVNPVARAFVSLSQCRGPLRATGHCSLLPASVDHTVLVETIPLLRSGYASLIHGPFLGLIGSKLCSVLPALIAIVLQLQLQSE